MNEESTARILQNLEEELKRLAGDPADQKAYLQALGTWDCLDELALEFDHSYRTLQLGGRLALACGLLSAELGRISGPENEALWYGDDALRRPEWCGIRKLADQALQSFGGSP